MTLYNFDMFINMKALELLSVRKVGHPNIKAKL